MIDIRFVGTGGAFDVAQGNSAAIVRCKNKTFLLDCGYTVYPRLRQLNHCDNIDYVLITHLHDDHVGSLSTFLGHQRYVSQCDEVQLLHPTAVFGDQLYAFLAHSMQRVEDKVRFVPLWTCPFVKAIDGTGTHIAAMTSFGYVFEDEDEIVVFSGDTGHPYLVYGFLHDLNPRKPVRVFHEATFTPNIKAHCFHKDLEMLAQKYPTWLYHLDASQKPDDCTIALVEKCAGLCF